jgi:uncharacterized protein (TIGR03086 family)
VRGARPDQDDRPSPCIDFTAGQVVDHAVYAMQLAHRAGTREPWPAEWAFDGPAPLLVGVPKAERADVIAREAEATARAWEQPQAWQGDSQIGGSSMPAAAIGAMMTAEFALHAWDLTRATGQPLWTSPAPRRRCSPRSAGSRRWGARGLVRPGGARAGGLARDRPGPRRLRSRPGWAPPVH